MGVKSLSTLLFVCGGIISAGPARAAEIPAKRTPAISAESRAALDRGLAWLASKQQKDGNWITSAKKGKHRYLAIEAFAVLAFAADGNQPGQGKYGQVVDRGLKYILSQQDPATGLFSVRHLAYENYNHGFTTMALAEIQAILGKGKNKQLDAALEKSLKLIEATQCRDGGWDYRAELRPRGHDLSLAVCQTAALASLRDGGHKVSDKVLAKAAEFIEKHYEERRGGFSYVPRSPVSLAMSSAGVVGLCRLGKHEDPRVKRSMEFIRRELSRLRRVKEGSGRLPTFQYALLYASRALYQQADKDWITAYSKLRDGVVKSQKMADAKSQGYWKSQRHVGGEPGDIYTTAIACLVLALPERHLPMWARDKRDGAAQSSENRNDSPQDASARPNK